MRLNPDDLVVTSFGTDAQQGTVDGPSWPGCAPTPGTGCGWCPVEPATP